MKRILLAIALFTAACGSDAPPKGKTPVVIVNNGANNGSNNGTSGANNGTSGGTNNGTVVQNNATAAPRILTFGASIDRMTQGDIVTFTAVVTDPDGIDDLIGGTLNDAGSDRPYGSFSTAAAEGSYSLSLSWNEIHNVEPITFEAATNRRFNATFFDQAGNSITQSVSLELHCNGSQACDGSCGLSECDGVCIDDRFEDLDNCGSCGNVCPIGADCDGTSCSCFEGETVCNDECVNVFSNDEHCGACGNACSCEAGLCFCNSDSQCDTGERCVEHEYRSSNIRNSCVRYSSNFRIAGGGKEGFLELNINGEWIPVCDGFASSPWDAANFACQELFGTNGTWEERDAMSDAPYVPALYCDDTATTIAQCDIALDYYCSFSDYVYVFCD